MFGTPVNTQIPALPTFTIIVTRNNGHVFVTDAQGIEHATILAETHVDAGSAWKAQILDNNGTQVGEYRDGTVKAHNGWTWR